MPPHRRLTDEVAESAALYALGLLSESEHSSIDRHLAEGCSICQSEISRCGDSLALWSEQTAVSPPASLRRKLLESLHERQDPKAGPPLLSAGSGLTVLRTTKMEWTPGPTPGLSVKVLFDDSEHDMRTFLVRMAPGSLYPSHRHKAVEEVYVLEGEFQVEGIELTAGDFCLSAPESVHPNTFSNSGCLLIVKASKHDEVLR